MKIVTVIFFFLSFLLPILTHADCDCETDDKDRNKTHVTPLKIGAIFSILAGGGVGVSLHTLGKWLSFLRPEKDIFFAFKAFAAGVILATSFIHILPNAFEKLTSPCLMSSPWQDFPFAGFCAMVAVIGMSVVETVATGYYNNRVKGGKVMGEVKMVSDEEKAGEVHDSHRIDGHVHGHDMINYDDDDTVMRHKVVSQVLELAIVMHSVILGVSLGASDRPTIKTMMISLSFHQFFEGIGLGGCLVQAQFKMRSMITMILLFSLTAPTGIAIGIGITSIYNENSPTALIVEGILNAGAAGILIYMSLVDLLAEDLMNPRVQRNGLLKLIIHISLLLGAGFISLMAKWI